MKSIITLFKAVEIKSKKKKSPSKELMEKTLNSEFVNDSIKYLVNFYKNPISLNDVIVNAGGNIIDDKNDCDIDLSPENLEKDKIINLLK